ncbi:hypothetical protein AgCh_009229 [Apium graveolens]
MTIGGLSARISEDNVTCYVYGKKGHYVNSCKEKAITCHSFGRKGHYTCEWRQATNESAVPRLMAPPTRGNNNSGNANNKSTAFTFNMTLKDAIADIDVIAVTLSVNSVNACVLIYSGATRSFICENLVNNLGLELLLLNEDMMVEILNQEVIFVSQVYPNCTIEIQGKHFIADLIPLKLGEFDVILRMDWLARNDPRVNFRLKEGPHVPKRAATGNEPSIPKPRHEWSDPDIEQVRKDKKAMNILFNGVDGDMFDNIINCKIPKEQYEYFHCEESESLIDIFSRFQKLLNALKLHGRVNQTKDSNLKFLRSLPKEWKPMIVSLRNSQDYKEFTLERLYGILKTCELEIEQDEKMEKGRKKEGSIALVAELEKEKEMKVEAVESTSKVCESKGKGLVDENEEQWSEDEMDDIDEHLAFLSRRFAKVKFKKNFGAAKPNRNMVDKSKFKCFKCGLAGYFASECRKPDSSKKKFEHVDYKQKYFEFLKQKERAFITQENDWAADGLDEDEEINYVILALMAK